MPPRPTKIEEACSAVLAGVAETGDVILACRKVSLPPGDFMRWVRAHDMGDLLADAKQSYAEKCMRELVEIADAEADVGPIDDAAVMAARAQAEQFRVKTRMDARKFVIGKLMPDKPSRISINNVQDNRSIRMTPLSRAFEEREKG